VKDKKILTLLLVFILSTLGKVAWAERDFLNAIHIYQYMYVVLWIRNMKKLLLYIVRGSAYIQFWSMHVYKDVNHKFTKPNMSSARTNTASTSAIPTFTTR